MCILDSEGNIFFSANQKQVLTMATMFVVKIYSEYTLCVKWSIFQSIVLIFYAYSLYIFGIMRTLSHSIILDRNDIFYEV